ncbi:PBECR4 domain-containing protein [Lactobacillus terrae]|uniref:PBECR4 domain-containing protein n=1 Tax=Lactobacillus terrae TaxID=2269374 RepID=UPI000C1B744F|nr:PBECR4 domain-containing protein [Lactobacillus terrae]
MKSNQIKSWEESYSFFCKNFIGKRVIYEYEYKNQTKILEVSMKKKHFLHLCGVKYSRGAKNFARDLERGRLDPKDVIMSSSIKNVVEAKIRCIDNLKYLISKGVRISDNGNFTNLSFDKAIRSNKDLVALSLICTQRGDYIPNSLLNLTYTKSMASVLKNTKSVTSISVIDIETQTKRTIF